MLLGKALYKALLYEAAAFPDPIASGYWKANIRASFRRPPVPEGSNEAVRRIKVAQKLLRTLQAANDGYVFAFEKIIESGYGFRGTEKEELLRPFLKPSNNQTPRKKPDLETNWFPDALSEILLSPISCSTPMKRRANLATPLDLPPRALAGTHEHQVFGALPPSRLKAIKKRWWNKRVESIINPPIAIAFPDLVAPEDNQSWSMTTEQKIEAKFLFSESGLTEYDVTSGLKKLETMEKRSQLPTEQRPKSPRKLRVRSSEDGRTSNLTASPAVPPNPQQLLSQSASKVPRWAPPRENTKWQPRFVINSRAIRRRYLQLLKKSPIFTITQGSKGNKSREQATENSIASDTDQQPSSEKMLRAKSLKKRRSDAGEVKIIPDEYKGRQKSVQLRYQVKNSLILDPVKSLTEMSAEDLWWLQQAR